MASPRILNIDSLLAPIEGANAAGVDLREDGTYRTLLSLRKEVSQAEEQLLRELAAGGTETQAADPIPLWRRLVGESSEALGRSKDLDLVAWTIEGLVRTPPPGVSGDDWTPFAGMRDGFELAHGIVEKFWEGLFPVLEDGSVEERFFHLGRLNETLKSAIGRIALTASTPHGSFELWQYHAAQQRKDADTLAAVEKAVQATPPTYYRRLLDDLDAVCATYGALDAMLTERCGADAPPSSGIKSSLEDARDAVVYLTRDLLPPVDTQPTAGVDAAGSSEAPSAPATPAAPEPRRLETRADAFEMLQEVARFFRRTEPHSPLGWILERAVHWGELPLPELIKELIPNQEARNTFQKLTEVQPPE